MGTIWKVYKKYISLIIVVLTVVSIVMWNINDTEDVKIEQDTSAMTQLAWQYEDGTIIDEYVELNDEERVSIVTRLPDEIVYDSALSYYDPGFHLQAYIGDELIYEAGADGNKTFGYETGSTWRNILLDESYAGKNLKLIFENQSGLHLRLAIESLMIGRKNDVVYRLSISSIGAYVEALISTIFSTILLIFSVFLQRAGYKKYGWIIGSLFLTSTTVGLWILSDSALAQLVFSNATIRYSIQHLSFMFIPFFCAMYYSFVLEDGRKAFMYYCWTYSFFMAVIMILNFSNLILMDQTRIITYIYMALLVLLVGYYGLLDFYRHENIGRLGNLLAFVLLAGIFAWGIYEFMMGRRSRISVYTGGGYIVLLLEITVTEVFAIINQFSNKQKMRNFEEIARVEQITGGNSRRMAVEWLKLQNISFYDSVYMLQMELVEFSAINATIGRVNGERVLRDTYKRNMLYLNKDELQCSLGNSKFLYFLTNRRDLDSFCKTLIHNMNEYMNERWDGVNIPLVFTAVKVETDDDLDTLQDKANLAFENPLADYHEDTHLYIYNEKCMEETKIRVELESKVPAAIRNDEFKMFLQPKVNPRTGKVEAAEALVRWLRNGQLVSPMKFIPMLENSGQINDVDIFMFRKVCEYQMWRKHHNMEPLTISVNVSKYGISKLGFFEPYKEIIRTLNVDTKYLEFELTESTAYDNIDSAINLIQEIHAIGAKASMDDFGSGFSNMGVIGKLNFDILKMDKMFFDHGFPTDEKNLKLVSGMIHVIKDLHMEIVCEGIEVKEQVDILGNLGVDLIQGYYYSKPLPADDFTAWEKEQNKRCTE